MYTVLVRARQSPRSRKASQTFVDGLTTLVGSAVCVIVWHDACGGMKQRDRTLVHNYARSASRVDLCLSPSEPGHTRVYLHHLRLEGSAILASAAFVGPASLRQALIASTFFLDWHTPHLWHSEVCSFEKGWMRYIRIRGLSAFTKRSIVLTTLLSGFRCTNTFRVFTSLRFVIRSTVVYCTAQSPNRLEEYIARQRHTKPNVCCTDEERFLISHRRHQERLI